MNMEEMQAKIEALSAIVEMLQKQNAALDVGYKTDVAEQIDYVMKRDDFVAASAANKNGVVGKTSNGVLVKTDDGLAAILFDSTAREVRGSVGRPDRIAELVTKIKSLYQ